MNCPTCGKVSYVNDTRITKNVVRRRRACLGEHRFTTYETVAKPDVVTLPDIAAQLEALAARLRVGA